MRVRLPSCVIKGFARDLGANSRRPGARTRTRRRCTGPLSGLGGKVPRGLQERSLSTSTVSYPSVNAQDLHPFLQQVGYFRQHPLARRRNLWCVLLAGMRLLRRLRLPSPCIREAAIEINFEAERLQQTQNSVNSGS